jgi:hypothetical protein
LIVKVFVQPSSSTWKLAGSFLADEKVQSRVRAGKGYEMDEHEDWMRVYTFTNGVGLDLH